MHKTKTSRKWNDPSRAELQSRDKVRQAYYVRLESEKSEKSELEIRRLMAPLREELQKIFGDVDPISNAAKFKKKKRKKAKV